MIGFKKIAFVACAAVLVLVGCGGQQTSPGQSVLPSAAATSTLPSGSRNNPNPIVIHTDVLTHAALSKDGKILSVTAKSIGDSDLVSLSYNLKRDDLENEFVSFHLKTQDIMLLRPRGGTITSCLCYGDVHTADTLTPQQIRSLDKLFDDAKKEMDVDAAVADYLKINHPDGWPSDWPPDSSAASD